MLDIARCYNIADLRAAAKRRLPRMLFEIIDRGTEDEIALRGNRAAIDRIKLMPRVGVDVAERSLATTLLGQPAAMPLAIAPTGWAGLFWHEGELALARAAKAAGVPFTLATGSMVVLERVAREVGGRLWFQVYIWPERNLTYDLVRRVAAAGYEAIVVTLDTPVAPNWEYFLRNGFSMPFRPTAANMTDMLMHPRWLFGTLMRYLVSTGPPRLQHHPPAARRRRKGAAAPPVLLNPTVDWADIRRLREMWPGKLLVKGILHPADALSAVAAGADGVVVSNHGGRNLDGALASFAALPAVVEAVGGKAAILVDSGVRRGSDLAKALALGADAAQTGRATLFGMAAAGEAGVARALDLLRRELDTTMAMLGCREIGGIARTILAPDPP